MEENDVKGTRGATKLEVKIKNDANSFSKFDQTKKFDSISDEL